MPMANVTRDLLATHIHRAYGLFARAIGRCTLGARAIALAPDGTVALVLPRYSDYWMLPGGGVRRRESPETAVRRELDEELGVTLQVAPEFFGEYLQRTHGVNDRVRLYVCRTNCADAGPRDTLEIRSACFFRFDALPPQLYPSTRRRLQEYSASQRPSGLADW